MRSRPEIQALLASVLDQAPPGAEAEVSYASESLTATRFGENAITQNTGTTSEELSVTLAFGQRHGGATTNKLGPDDLAETVRRAEATARLAPEDPEYVPLPGPQVYEPVPAAYFDDTAALAPDKIASDVAAVATRARSVGYVASGLFQVATRSRAVANHRGLFGHDVSTAADYSTTVHGPNGAGKAAASHNDYRRIDVARLAETAVANARLAQDPTAIGPGEYTVVMEPLAVASLLGFAPWTMSARDAEEGTSAFAGTVGSRLLGDKVTLELRMDDPDLPASPFGEAGLATRPTTWVERGVVKRLIHSRYWAARKGVEPDAASAPLSMSGEDQSVEDLIRRCRRGLLVKNLWYIRFVDRRTMMLTGMTRDGLFLVEDGEVVRPVKNLRWNESPLVLLQNVVGLSRPERVGGWSPTKVPAVMSEGFTFTSTTDSV